jgi:glyoxylase-like metal-dependent hydrolase (beta-lactamase superfamily II)
VTDGAWTGGAWSERVTCVLAANPGPMTLDGTNTYVLAEPGSALAVVVDPGPDDAAHAAAILRALDGRSVDSVLLTHGHADHSQGAEALAERTGCAVRSHDPGHRRAAAGLEPVGLDDGDVLEVGGLRLEVVATPGHTADSVCLLLPAEAALLTGDTVLGRGTTVVAHPDGTLADYLGSLDRLEATADACGGLRLLPGHGPAGADVATLVRQYRRHRLERLDQVVAAVAAGAGTAQEVVQTVYADVPRQLWPAATASVLAQLDHLGAEHRLRQEHGRWRLSGPGA